MKKDFENFKTWFFQFQCKFVLQLWKNPKTYSQMKYEWFFNPWKSNFAAVSKIRPLHNTAKNEGRFGILEKIFFTQLFIIVDYLIPWKEKNWRPQLPKCSQIGPFLQTMSVVPIVTIDSITFNSSRKQKILPCGFCESMLRSPVRVRVRDDDDSSLPVWSVDESRISNCIS